MESERDNTVKECLYTIGGGLMFLAGAIGVLAGIWYIAMVDRPREDAQREQWLRVPAQLEVCYVNHGSPRGKRGVGSHTVHARYSYVVDGQLYHSEDLGTYHHEEEQMLQSCSGYSYDAPAKKTPEGLTCFVNPENPQEAKLFLAPSWVPMWVYPLAAVIALAFGAFCGYMTLGGIRDLFRLLLAKLRS